MSEGVGLWGAAFDAAHTANSYVQYRCQNRRSFMGNFLFIRSIAIVLALAFITACGSILKSDVVTFHEGALPAGETIRVEALDPLKAQTLEFRQYARQVNNALRNVGYRPVADNEEAELIAQLDYAVETGPVELRLERDGPYAYYHFSYGRFRNPFYFGLSDRWEPEVRSTPTYIRSLTMAIVNNDAQPERLFEGRVESIGAKRQLPEVMQYLITALFANFPGESGVTKVVTIEMD